jgi:hypothetical protein
MLNVWSSPAWLCEPLENFGVANCPTSNVWMARCAGVERKCEAQPGVKGCLVTVSLEHPTPCHRADLRASQFLEHGDTPVFLCAARCFRTDEDQLGGVRRVTGRIGHGDLARVVKKIRPA